MLTHPHRIEAGIHVTLLNDSVKACPIVTLAALQAEPRYSDNGLRLHCVTLFSDRSFLNTRLFTWTSLRCPFSMYEWMHVFSMSLEQAVVHLWTNRPTIYFLSPSSVEREVASTNLPELLMLGTNTHLWGVYMFKCLVMVFKKKKKKRQIKWKNSSKLA